MSNVKVTAPVDSIVPTKNITADVVYAMLTDYCKGMTQKDICKKYSIGQSRVSKALRGLVEPTRFVFNIWDDKPPQANELLFSALKRSIAMNLTLKAGDTDEIEINALKEKLQKKNALIKQLRNEMYRLKKKDSDWKLKNVELKNSLTEALEDE